MSSTIDIVTKWILIMEIIIGSFIALALMLGVFLYSRNSKNKHPTQKQKINATPGLMHKLNLENTQSGIIKLFNQTTFAHKSDTETTNNQQTINTSEEAETCTPAEASSLSRPEHSLDSHAEITTKQDGQTSIWTAPEIASSGEKDIASDSKSLLNTLKALQTRSDALTARVKTCEDAAANAL